MKKIGIITAMTEEFEVIEELMKNIEILDKYNLKLFLKTIKSLFNSLHIGTTKNDICIIYKIIIRISAEILVWGSGNKSVIGV